MAHGNIFVVRGDIAQCQADAVVFSTSVALEGDGELHPSFLRWPGFETWYRALPRNKRVGDTDGLPPHDPKRGTPGIAVPEVPRGRAENMRG